VTSVLGVDGWRGGWIAARVDGSGEVEWRAMADAAEVLAEPVDVAAVDIPMGLPEAGRRRCDVVARTALGAAGSSVFAAPVRPVVERRMTYQEARAVLASLGGPSMSAQAFGLVGKVREMDRVLTPEAQQRVVEVHPELSFRRLAGAAEMPGKKTAAGVLARLRALRTWLPGVEDAVAAVPAPVPVDDVLDALVCAWSAQRILAGRADRLGDGERDSRGLLMQIVVPRA
jgi:predicted RNase H-like nuclease